MDLHFTLLGPLTASADGAGIDLGPAKQRAVLALLLLHANRPVPAAAIVDAVWAGDPPENGVNVVQKHIAGLRRALEPDRSPRTPSSVLTLDGAGYRLHVPPGALDTEAFDAAVRAARALLAGGDAATAATGLREALGLWRGEPLAGLGGPVFEAARQRLHESRGEAWELLAHAETALGRHAALGAELVAVVEEFPAREGLRYARMLALYRQGRQAEALAAYREARDYLSDEVGVEPGERLQDLHRRILAADPALGPAPEAAAPALPAPAPPPARKRVPRPDPWDLAWTKAIGMLALACCSCGLATSVIVGVLAWRRRSWPNAVAAVVYAALSIGMLVALEAPGFRPYAEDVTVWDVMVMAGCSVPGLLGGAHALVLILSRRAGAPSAVEAAAQDEMREATRQQARHILVYRPEIARELGIGRPDLVRWYDDGGLVDVNAVPEQLLAQLPGMTPELARGLAAERDRGPFGSLHDLVARSALPPDRAHDLRQLLVFGVTTAPRRG